MMQRDHDGPDIINPFSQSLKQLADQQALARQSLARRNQQRMTINGPCGRWHLLLTAEARIITQGFGEREDRRWLIETMSYQLSASGMTIEFSLAVDIKLNGLKMG